MLVSKILTVSSVRPGTPQNLFVEKREERPVAPVTVNLFELILTFQGLDLDEASWRQDWKERPLSSQQLRKHSQYFNCIMPDSVSDFCGGTFTIHG
ncbi:hypothetical protein NL676_008895 [Syzygium grande]|nr:hypothetical protein NL676_008895 [Syzygium grande]